MIKYVLPPSLDKHRSGVAGSPSPEARRSRSGGPGSPSPGARPGGAGSSPSPPARSPPFGSPDDAAAAPLVVFWRVARADLGRE